jgi:hypothetical protein
MVRTLLIEACIVIRMGNPDWTAPARKTHGVNYESLRKAVVGERGPSEKIMLATAQALGVKPTIFAEYRLLKARRSLDPDHVGWSAATKALNQWEAKG